jgi:nucleoside-diphosphate-sugar epimerase
VPGAYLESPDNDRFLEWSQVFAERFFQAGGQHLLALGSCAEYQPARTPLVEDQSPLSDTTRYARCKNALRLALENLAQRHDARVGWGRVFYPYGPGEHPARLCSSLIQQLARGEKVILKTPNSTKDYIYIEDLASAILTTIESGFQGTINFGTGWGVTVKEMAQTIAGIMGCPHLVEEAAVPVCDPMSYMVADATKLRGLGWTPRIKLPEGIQRLREHWQTA